MAKVQFSKMLVLCFWILLLTSGTVALIGYDCGSPKLNITSLSLLEVGECDIPSDSALIKTEAINIQLLQIKKFGLVHVRQCKIERHRIAYYCGMSSHVSIVSMGEMDYVEDISRAECEDMHRTLSLKDDNGRYSNEKVLVMNGTVNIPRTRTFAGSLSSNGACTAASHNDGYDSQCMDLFNGNTFWHVIPARPCNYDNYGILYDGNASKIIDSSLNGDGEVYSLESADYTFALQAIGEVNLCGYRIIRTEHPQLFIYEKNHGYSFANNGLNSVTVNDMDLFNYINSKFVFVERHVRKKLKNMYRDLVQQRCDSERRVLKTSLSLATRAPDEFIYDLMKGPVYMAFMAGEVVHIIKCVPVEVTVAQPNGTCYAGLPVKNSKNENFFLMSRTHVLKKIGTEIPCNNILPVQFRIDGDCVQLLHDSNNMIPSSEMLKPATRNNWRNVNPHQLATTGIYSQDLINNLRDRIMYPMEKPTALHNLASEMSGYSFGRYGANHHKGFLNIFDNDAVNTLIDSTWSKMWRNLITFGSLTSGISAIILLMYIAKSAFNFFVRGYALHQIYGWSMHLFGAVLSSITHFLLYARNGGRPDDRQNNQQQRRDDVPSAPPLPPVVQSSAAPALGPEPRPPQSTTAPSATTIDMEIR